MKLISTKFNGLKVVQSKNFNDSRGFFKENFKQSYFKKIKFVFGCISSSKKNVLNKQIYMQSDSKITFLTIYQLEVFRGTSHS